MSNKGQSLVELAISFVVILLLLVGTVEFGIIYFKVIQLRDSVHEGIAYATTSHAPPGNTSYDGVADIINRIKSTSNTPIKPEDIDVEVLYNEGAKTFSQACFGDEVRIIATHEHKLVTPFSSLIFQDKYITLKVDLTGDVFLPLCGEE